MSKHTPGPWYIVPPTKQSIDISVYAVTPTHGNPDWVARVYGEGVLSQDTAERDANASLIAAAPEMYEALKIANRALVAIGMDETMAGEYEIITDALARAEGLDPSV